MVNSNERSSASCKLQDWQCSFEGSREQNKILGWAAHEDQKSPKRNYSPAVGPICGGRVLGYSAPATAQLCNERRPGRTCAPQAIVTQCSFAILSGVLAWLGFARSAVSLCAAPSLLSHPPPLLLFLAPRSHRCHRCRALALLPRRVPSQHLLPPPRRRRPPPLPPRFRL